MIEDLTSNPVTADASEAAAEEATRAAEAADEMRRLKDKETEWGELGAVRGGIVRL